VRAGLLGGKSHKKGKEQAPWCLEKVENRPPTEKGWFSGKGGFTKRGLLGEEHWGRL